MITRRECVRRATAAGERGRRLQSNSHRSDVLLADQWALGRQADEAFAACQSYMELATGPILRKLRHRVPAMAPRPRRIFAGQRPETRRYMIHWEVDHKWITEDPNDLR